MAQDAPGQFGLPRHQGGGLRIGARVALRGPVAAGRVGGTRRRVRVVPATRVVLPGPEDLGEAETRLRVAYWRKGRRSGRREAAMRMKNMDRDLVS